MEPNHKLTGWVFYPLWALLSLVGTLFGFVMFFLLEVAIAEVHDLPPFPATLLGMGVFALVFGLVAAIAEFAIVLRYHPDCSAWIGATLLGFMAASPAVLAWGGGFGPRILPGSSLLMALAFGLVLGLFQWLFLKEKGYLPAWWIGLSVVCWLLADLVALGMKSISTQVGPVYYWTGLLFFVIVLTGSTLSLMLRNPSTSP